MTEKSHYECHLAELLAIEDLEERRRMAGLTLFISAGRGTAESMGRCKAAHEALRGL